MNFKYGLAFIQIGVFTTCILAATLNTQAQAVSLTKRSLTDCQACERIHLFSRCKEIIGKKVWSDLTSEAHTRPLLYFTESNTYVVFGDNEQFKKYSPEALECGNGLSLLKLQRMDSQPFHMQNAIDFKDPASLYYYQPMMLCSDVETLIKVVPDFDKTEDWLQLVMHEYFHSYQFSHQATLTYLAETIQVSADTLDKIYLQHAWFRELLEKENLALLNAIRVNGNDSIKLYIDEFLETRKTRRMKFENLNQFRISIYENFWETIEGSARYAEYYLAGNFKSLDTDYAIQCDSLFRNYKDYTHLLNFENEKEFVERTRIMQAYYYVTGFNLCRLMDKMGIPYKQNLFDNPGSGLYDIFSKSISR